MYPNLTPTLLALLAISGVAALYIALRKPVLRRLAVRQVTRRRQEATLVIVGSMLGTAIIVSSLIVGDTLTFSVKQVAYQNLGPIDETVTSATAEQGDKVAGALGALTYSPAVDGVLSARGDLAAVAMGEGGNRVAEPRVAVWDMNLEQAASFGGTEDGGSGISGPSPKAGQVVINQDLASALGAQSGDELTFYLSAGPVRLRVARVLPTRGVAGVGIDGVTRDAFLPFGTLTAPAASSGSAPPAAGAAISPAPPTPEVRSFTFVSNAGGVEGGNAGTDAVTKDIEEALGPLVHTGTSVEQTKQTVLDTAKQTGDSLGSLFLMIGSFAIIAGILLLVNIFVMLAEARKPELGMLRAVGMKRSRLVRSFIIEGTIYALIAAVLGILVGIGVGRLVVIAAARIFNAQQTGGNLQIVYHVTPVSLINGFALGFLISFATVALTSIRISRVNIIAAIRDLPSEKGRTMKTRWLVVSGVGAAVFAAASVSAIVTNEPVGAILYPAITAFCLAPFLLRIASHRAVYSGIAVSVLAWTLMANTVRPHLLDRTGSAAFIVMGVLLTFAAVMLLSQNQEAVAAVLRPLIERRSQLGLSTRLAVAYPLGKRFRTGAILVMYGLVVFTLVFMTVLSSLVQNTVDRQVRSASGGFSIRADLNPTAPIADPSSAFSTGRFADQVSNTSPLLAARATVTDLVPTVPDPVDGVVIGADPSIMQPGGFPLAERKAGFSSDLSVWEAIFTNPQYVIVDNMLGQLNGGGPPMTLFHPGETFTLTNPLTGMSETKTVVGMLDSGYAFYGMGGGMFSPIIESVTAGEEQFGSTLRPAAVLIASAPGASDQTLAAQLQGEFLREGLVATRIRQTVEESFASTRGFFELMQGFIALGLLVGIAGLGVVMIRAVRERRRSIGVLRALGFPSKTVQRAFLTESLLVTLEGVVLGTVLSVVTTYQLFKNSGMFKTAEGGFSIPWASIAILLVAATAASLLATVWPARAAARIRPAVALRVAD